jgi:hypothetical protein
MQLPQLGSQECKVHRSHSRYAAVHNATRAIVVELSSRDPTNHFRSRLNRIPSMTDFDPAQTLDDCAVDVPLVTDRKRREMLSRGRMTRFFIAEGRRGELRV